MVTYSITTRSKLRHALAARAPLVDLSGFRAGLFGSVLVGVAGVMAPATPAIAQTCPIAAPMNEVPKLPSDVCGNVAVGDEPGFYELSWQLFRYLVWPAAPGSRGEPDPTRRVSDMGGPRVFETYKADWEVFRQNAEDPGVWNQFPQNPCSNHRDISPSALILASTSKFGNLSVGRRSDSAHVLIAQNGTYVRYQMSYSGKLFDSIRLNKLYDLREVKRLTNALPDNKIDPRAFAPYGSMVLKSAWLELPANTPTVREGSPRYYVRDDAWVQIPGTNECRQTRVGLVGLHIVYKTFNRPHWIWASFEHVANVPEQGDRAGRRYTFNNGNQGAAMEPNANEAYLVSAQQPGQVPPPYQVERRQKIAPDANTKNREWQARLKQQRDSVWQNYKLVTTQWLGARQVRDESIANHQIFPTCTNNNPASANTTMETFQQVCVKDMTCLGCHNLARTTDHIFSIKLNANQPPAFEDRSSRDEIVKQLEDVLKKVK